MAANKRPWDVRPSALGDSYKNASRNSLMKHYLSDALTATKKGGLELPNKPTGTSKETHLRTCQWNIYSLSADWLGRRKPGAHATAVAEAILEVDADVIILNEFGARGRGFDRFGVDLLSARLEAAGHQIYEASCSYPTAIATRLPVVSSDEHRLDADRAAVCVTVNTRPHNGSIPNHDINNVTIYGTHLECSDDLEGQYRLEEATNLLKVIESNSIDKNESVIISGDFNQQRCCDYTKKEWKVICNNKRKRSSPTDDGVSKVLQNASFVCCYDNKNVDTNWTGDHPPSTHWSGTTIDYSYSRGSNLSLVGVYVSSSNLSDHRMVVCDWKITSERTKTGKKVSKYSK